jgi:hypothetical protein
LYEDSSAYLAEVAVIARVIGRLRYDPATVWVRVRGQRQSFSEVPLGRDRVWQQSQQAPVSPDASRLTSQRERRPDGEQELGQVA